MIQDPMRTFISPFVAIITLACSFAAHAGNGMYLIGYGTESALMGGADVAVSRDAFAANNNPAGMTQLVRRALDIEVAPFYNWGTDHTDSFGNFRKFSRAGTSAYANGAYAQKIDDSPFAIGAALVVQGGIGWKHTGLNVNPAVGGGRDDASSMFTVIKLAPALAWKINEQWSLGAALGLNYLAGNQEVFPNTSTAAFQGFRFNGASGFGISTKLGLQYHPSQDVTLGMTYGTKVSIPLKNGFMRLNRSDIGLGVVRYDNAGLQGMRLPEELAIGTAFHPTQSLLTSVQLKHYNWSKALNKLTLSAGDPRNPLAPPTVILPSALDASDQDVLELGLAYDYDKDNVIYVGFNRGRRLIPERNLSPTFALIYSSHYTLGLKHRISDEWQAAGGIEVYPPKSVTYDSPLFGPRAVERHNGAVLHLSLARRW